MNEPLLKDEEEKIAFADMPVEKTEAPVAEPAKTEEKTEAKADETSISEPTTPEESTATEGETEVSKAPMHEIEATTTIDVITPKEPEDVKEQAEATTEVAAAEEHEIAPASISKEEKKSKDSKPAKEHADSELKGKLSSYIVTLVLSAIVIFILVQACLGFYFGFRYRNAEKTPTPTTTEQQ